MAVCDTCGNDYHKAFTITRGAETGVFDSFECAIAKMAPSCAHCGCRIMGHGVESGQTTFCCSHCAREMGHPSATDSKS